MRPAPPGVPLRGQGTAWIDDDLMENSIMAYIYGTSGNDVLEGTTAKDYILGFGGDDVIVYKEHNDVIYGGDGIDTVDASGDTYTRGIVAVLGNAENSNSDGYVGYRYLNDDDPLPSHTFSVENFIGSIYDDLIDGSVGDNALFGNGGDDRITGYDGNDRIYGGTGVDHLYGGHGRDTFIFGQHDTGVSYADTIADFKHREGDRINLSAIDAKVTQGGNQAFTFIGQANFTAHHPGTVDYHFTSRGITVAYNTDNDAAPEGQILLHSVVGLELGLVAGDFVL